MARMSLIVLVAFALMAGCRGRSADREPAAAPTAQDGSSAPPAVAPVAAVACTKQPFADKLPISEASGAAYVAAAGDRGAFLLVIGDSGTRGQFLEIDVDTGAVLASGSLPVDGAASDDLEGLTVQGGRVYAITSSGWMREWTRKPDGSGYDQVGSAYALARHDDGEPKLICHDPHTVNCGPNYEGLCLRGGDVTDGACAGFAASKAHGTLYCVVRSSDGRLSLDRTRAIPVTEPGKLTGCHFEPDRDRLWAGSNLFARSQVWRIDDWRMPAEARIVPVAELGPGFPEALALGPGGVVYRFSDTGGAPSLVNKYICE